MAENLRKQGRGRGKGIVSGGGADSDEESDLEMSSDFSSGGSTDDEKVVERSEVNSGGIN